MLRIESVVSIRLCADAAECVSYAAEELTRYLAAAGIQTCMEPEPHVSCVTVHLNDHVPGLPGGAFRRSVSQDCVLVEAAVLSTALTIFSSHSGFAFSHRIVRLFRLHRCR